MNNGVNVIIDQSKIQQLLLTGNDYSVEDTKIISQKQNSQYLLYKIISDSNLNIKKNYYPILDKEEKIKVDYKQIFPKTSIKPTEQKESKIVKQLQQFYHGQLPVDKLDMDNPIIKQRFSQQKDYDEDNILQVYVEMFGNQIITNLNQQFDEGEGMDCLKDIKKVFQYKAYQKIANNKDYIQYVIYIIYLVLYKYYYTRYNQTFVQKLYNDLSKQILDNIQSISQVKDKKQLDEIVDQMKDIVDKMLQQKDVEEQESSEEDFTGQKQQEKDIEESG